MRVSIDEARQNGLTAEVNFFCAACRQGEDFFVGSDGEEASVGDGDGLGFGLARVYGPEVSVVQDEFWLGAVYWDERVGTHGA
jgi:hypothetical protein